MGIYVPSASKILHSIEVPNAAPFEVSRFSTKKFFKSFHRTMPMKYKRTPQKVIRAIKSFRLNGKFFFTNLL